MRNDSSNTPAGPWRLLILDRDDDGGDARWLIATITGPGDVRPAGPADSAPDEVTRAWVAARHGQPVTLTPLPLAVMWRVNRH
jgi:hypothetical protein